jgi:hypothetical protein
MDDPHLVRELESFGDLARDVDGVIDIECSRGLASAKLRRSSPKLGFAERRRPTPARGRASARPSTGSGRP